MRPIRLKDGTVGAEATMKIDAEAGDVPVDSTLNLRPRSVLGLKYVDLTRGRSKEVLEDGDVMRQDRVTYPVELDDFHRIFNERTRRAVQTNLQGFGNALSNRGYSLNTTIQTLPRFLTHLTPVAETLADERNRLGRFFKELGDAARIVSPVADRYAHQFEAGADTFEAWSRYPDRLRQTIPDKPPPLRTGVRSFRVQRPFLAHPPRFRPALRAATALMPTALPRLPGPPRTGLPV